MGLLVVIPCISLSLFTWDFLPDWWTISTRLRHKGISWLAWKQFTRFCDAILLFHVTVLNLV